MQNAKCRMQSAECKMKNAECKMIGGLCGENDVKRQLGVGIRRGIRDDHGIVRMRLFIRLVQGKARGLL